MSAANRERGAAAERAVVAWLRANGWPDARRTLAGDGRQDTDVAGIPRTAVEVKDRAKPAVPSWQRQAVAAATPDTALVVVVRRLRGTPDVARWPSCWTLDAGLTWSYGEFAACPLPIHPPQETP